MCELKGVVMKKKLALTLAAAAGALSLLVPMTSQAAKVKPACVVVNGPGSFHLQVGYSPTGPDGCKHLP